MLSLNEIIYTLSPKQDKIVMEDKKNNKINTNCHDSLYNRYVLSKKFDTRDLFICLTEILGDNFYIYKSTFKDSFIESILNILSDKFILSDEERSKKNCINYFRQKIGYDLNDKNLYYKFGYNKKEVLKRLVCIKYY